MKSFSAHQINKLEKPKGAVWEQESFDRMIRSERDLQEKFEYITRNPWDAESLEGGEDYPWVWRPGRPLELRRAGTARTARRTACAACAPRRQGKSFVGTHALLYEPEGLENPGLGRDR